MVALFYRLVHVSFHMGTKLKLNGETNGRIIEGPIEKDFFFFEGVNKKYFQKRRSNIQNVIF